MTMSVDTLLRCGVVATIVMAAGCAAADEDDVFVSQGVILHPTVESIPAAGHVTHVISSGGAMLDEDAGALVDQLAGAREILSIGVLEGETHEMFGQIQDISVDAEGNFYVLDDRNMAVRAFDPEGNYLRQYGQPGAGPGEFRAPIALAIDTAHRLLVADRARRITAFSLEHDHADTTMALPYGPRDLCIGATRIYVHGVTAEQKGVIHAFDATGAYVHSFGSGYQFGGSLAREDLSRGSLACSRQTDNVMFLFRYLPVMRGHSPQADAEWVTMLSDFAPMRITEDARTRTLTYSGQAGVSDVLHQATVINGTGYAIVQVLRRTPESIQEQREYAEILTYVVSMDTGAGGYAGNALPPVYAVAAGQIYTAINWPYPRVIVYKLPLTTHPGV